MVAAMAVATAAVSVVATAWVAAQPVFTQDMLEAIWAFTEVRGVHRVSTHAVSELHQEKIAMPVVSAAMEEEEAVQSPTSVKAKVVMCRRRRTATLATAANSES